MYQPVLPIIGEGCIHEIPRHINNIGVNKALIVTDEGLVKIGTVKMVTDVLDEAGKPYAIYSGVKPNPTVSIVNEAKKLTMIMVAIMLLESVEVLQLMLQRVLAFLQLMVEQ